MEGEKLDWYLILDGTHSFRGVRKRKGEKIQLTQKEAERIGDRIEMVTVEPATPVPITPITPVIAAPVPAMSASAPLPISRDWSLTLAKKASDIIGVINETDSIDDLTSLREAEEKGQNRIGVLNAIKKRMGQIG